MLMWDMVGVTVFVFLIFVSNSAMLGKQLLNGLCTCNGTLIDDSDALWNVLDYNDKLCINNWLINGY